MYMAHTVTLIPTCTYYIGEMVFRLDVDLKFARSDFGEPDFFSRVEMSASLYLDGKVAWVKDRFAKCEIRMEKVSAHDFRSNVGM